MDNLYPLLLLTILFGCTQTQNKTANRTLNSYEIFLSTLDTSKVESATTAAKKYKALFKNEDVFKLTNQKVAILLQYKHAW